MKIKMFIGAALLIAATVMVTTAMIAPQDEKAPGGQEMSEEEMMKAWMEANKITDHHKKLAHMAGEWVAENTHFGPTGDVMGTSTDRAVSTSVLGGRFIQMSYHGSFGPMPFEGMGMLGYDTMTNEFVHVWFDSMSNAPFVSRGKPGDDPKTIKTTGEYKDPASGQMMTNEYITTVISKDEHHLDLWATMGNVRFHQMKIKYTRKK